ncbi:CNDH2 protein, partial [Bombycilla garrulus]|nr:CNDH2 protein [Bombycilla garrulus]
MEEVDSRFLHLLQPIRDLTKNWEVDVAAQLAEYLEELDQICISFDNGKTSMNFMEAALLIQGSACVYSRKVEYLYTLVYQTLDCISKKTREKLPTSLGPDGRDADATFTEHEEEFLSLDDIPETSQANVDMRRDQQPAAVTIVPLTPMSLVPPEEGEKKENPLLSRRGEVLASRRDFRMNTSTPHASGALLLELAGLSPTHPQEQPLGTATGTRGLWGGTAIGTASCSPVPCPPAAAPGRGAAERPSAGPGTAPVRALSFCEEAARDCSTPVGAAGPEDDDDIPVAPGNDDGMEVTPVPNEHIEAQRSTPRTRGYVLRERAPSQDPKPHSKEEQNPWQSFDPFGDCEEKPFRKGRPLLVPHGLKDMAGGKRKRRAPRKLQDFMRFFSAAYNNVTEGQKSRRKGPSFADLEVLYWQHFKERLAAHRKFRSRGEPLWEPELEQELERGADSEEGADDFMEHEDLEHEVPEELGGGSLDPPEPAYEELVRKNVELFMASSQKFAQETELSQRIRLWEERIEPLLQEQAGTPGESRAPFSVRDYGLALTERCAELGEWHSLASLVAGEPPFEVCRYLLASLQLANDEEVELAQDEGLEEALDTARLRLLSARPAHERFQNFQLPS